VHSSISAKEDIEGMDNRTWRELCEAIMKERDPQQLMILVNELNQALELREKQLRLHAADTPPQPE